jgi:hypothetical protein
LGPNTIAKFCAFILFTSDRSTILYNNINNNSNALTFGSGSEAMICEVAAHHIGSPCGYNSPKAEKVVRRNKEIHREEYHLLVVMHRKMKKRKEVRVTHVNII